MHYFCCDKHRRNEVITSEVNGIDFIEVRDDTSLPNNLRQRSLSLHFVKSLGGLLISTSNIVVLGGERITDVDVVSVVTGMEDNVLEIEVNKAGDFSIYTLCLVANGNETQALAGIDPASASVDFSFKVECQSDFDCEPIRACPPEPKAKLPINYLAKDYASFRHIMLDRMALIAPDWQSRNAADLGMTLVEILAYAGDHLSYQQDAVQTEGYFDLARHRISVKRHARLVDYFMHDGCNARTWIHVEVDTDTVLDHHFMVDGREAVTQFFTKLNKMDTVLEPNSRLYQDALKFKPTVFEPIQLLEPKAAKGEEDQLADITLFSKHNEMYLYTWSDAQCCLPKGALQATLSEHFEDLKINDVLVFEEVVGPLTGAAKDANLSHRHAVKLSSVELVTDPVTNNDITIITWRDEDALPFAVCISNRTDNRHGSNIIENITVVHGNIVLCDHGQTVNEILSPKVPEPLLYYRQNTDNNGGHCKAEEPEAVPIRYKPRLSNLPLTHAVGYNYSEQSAVQAMSWELTDAKPFVRLESHLGVDSTQWNPVKDLLNSEPFDNHFVVEIDNEGDVLLRFGNDQQGKLPEPETEFSAYYRVGNGVAGNIGVDSITHIVSSNNNIISVRNLLPAQGGTEMETMASVRDKAPFAYRKQERAVTETDYSNVTERQNEIQKAQATFRWTGSWHTVFLTIDRVNGLGIDNDYKRAIRDSVEKYRMAGHDLNVDAPIFAPLEIEMFICVNQGYFRSEVKRSLIDIFSNLDLRNGQRGVFHPDNLTFGQTVYLSPLYEAAHKVAGVESVQITKFQRLHQNDNTALDDGKLIFDRLEIAQLDNNPSFRERGLFTLTMGGGK